MCGFYYIPEAGVGVQQCTMLSSEMSALIDKQQSRALGIIFGFDKSSDDLLALSGLEPLSVRRSDAVDRFALKMVANPRFTDLFPLRSDTQSRSRVSQKYLELHARSSRLYNSPIFNMRRRLNALDAKDGGREARAADRRLGRARSQRFSTRRMALTKTCVCFIMIQRSAVLAAYKKRYIGILSTRGHATSC